MILKRKESYMYIIFSTLEMFYVEVKFIYFNCKHTVKDTLKYL